MSYLDKTAAALGDALARARREIADLQARWSGDRERLERELRKIKTVTDAANFGIAVADLEGNIDYINDYFAQAHGYKPEELIGKNLTIFHSDEQLPDVARINQGLIATGSYGPLEVWHIHRDGTDFPTMMSGVVIKDAEGIPLYMAATAIDITERKRAKEKLAESEDRFRAMAEFTSDWIWEVDENAGYTYASPKVEDLLGYSPDEILGKTPFDLMPPDEAERIAKEFGLAAEARTPFADLVNTNLHKDGHPVVLETSGVPIFDAAGTFRGYRGIDRDITERKAAEAQLIRYEKMAALGQLLAGVAHEINNPVNFIYGNMSLIDEACTDMQKLTEELVGPAISPALREKLEGALGTPDLAEFFNDLKVVVRDCNEGARRVKQIVQSLRSFAHPERGRRVSTDVCEGLDNTLTLLAHELGESIRVERHFGEMPAVIADPAQFNQVFLNLLLNAAQAIEGKGIVRIETEHDGDDVVIRITDTGCGIPSALQERIFEPFFTTKEIGRGTGLGLSICYSIVEAHGGTIDVESEPGRGSTFTVRLPVGA
jgi:PAS domain S-box-containing protein